MACGEGKITPLHFSRRRHVQAMILSLLGLMVCCSSVCRSKEPAKRSAFAQRGCSESRDVRVPNTNGERRMSRQTMFAAPGHVDDAPLATASRVVDTCSAPAVSCAAPAAVTLAKTSHWRSRWIHRASACSTTRFSAAQALYLAPEPVVGFVRAPRQRRWFLSFPVASQENLSCPRVSRNFGS